MSSWWSADAIALQWIAFQWYCGDRSVRFLSHHALHIFTLMLSDEMGMCVRVESEGRLITQAWPLCVLVIEFDVTSTLRRWHLVWLKLFVKSLFFLLWSYISPNTSELLTATPKTHHHPPCHATHGQDWARMSCFTILWDTSNSNASAMKQQPSDSNARCS